MELTESNRERLGDNYGCAIDNQSKTNSKDKTIWGRLECSEENMSKLMNTSTELYKNILKKQLNKH